MNTINKTGLSKVHVLLLVSCVFSVTSVNANDWQEGYDSKLGFSEFSPPSGTLHFKKNIKDRQWVSGRSFNEQNKVRYSPRVSKNPWKPLRSSFRKETFGGKRPWGNVPDRKPESSNMKLHDLRFKKWIEQQDLSYRNNPYGRSGQPFSGAYGYPGLGYSNPLITPPIYPGAILNSGRYGRVTPYTGLFNAPGFW